MNEEYISEKLHEALDKLSNQNAAPEPDTNIGEKSPSNDLPETKTLLGAGNWLKENDPDLFEFLERHCVRARMIQHLENYALNVLEKS